MSRSPTSTCGSTQHNLVKPMSAARLTACAWALLAIFIGSAPAAIPSAPDLPSQKQYLAKLAEFNLRGCLAVYKTTGKHNDKWDKEAIQFITDALSRPSPQKDLEPLGALEHRGHDLFARGCDDGLVQYLYGMIQSDEEHTADAEHSLRTACDSMHAQGYPPNLAARAASEVCTIMASAGRNGEIQPYANIVAAATREMFKTHLFNNTGQRELLIGELAESGKIMQISCEADFGKDWDMTADVDFVHSGADWSSTGLTVSPPGYTSYTGFNLNRQKQNITVHIMDHGEMETGAAPAADHNVITLKRRGDTIKAIVNGKQVYEGEPFNFVARRDIGFGGWPNSPGDSYRYRNVKIRKAMD